jgi:hypothetical protein
MVGNILGSFVACQVSHFSPPPPHSPSDLLLFLLLLLCCIGGNVDHVSFITSSQSTQACWVEEDYTQGTYCQNILHSVPLQGVVILHGLQRLHNLSTWDELALASTIETIFHSSSPLYSSFSYTTDESLHGLKVQFTTYIPTELFQLDGLDPDNLHEAYSLASNLLSQSISSGVFVKTIEQYLSSHQRDGHHYDLYDHGFIELLSVHEEHTWKNYLPMTYPPTSIPTQQLTTSLPSSVPINSTNSIPLTGDESSKSKHSSPQSSSLIPTPLVILIFVVSGMILIFYLNKSSSSSSSSSSSTKKNGKKQTKSSYHELSTSSHHKSDPLYGDDDDDDEEEEEEEDDIEAKVSFTECLEDHTPQGNRKERQAMIKVQKKKLPSSSNHPSPSLSPSSSSSSLKSSKSKNPMTKPKQQSQQSQQEQVVVVKRSRKGK